MSEKTKILLVDDEADYTQPMVFWLESKGYDVSVAPNGKIAVDIVKENTPHIVFLDLKMPIMDGIETLRRIREFNKKLPVIIITVEYTNEEKFAEARKLGTSGFFPKKGSFEELERVMDAALRTHKKLKGNE